MFLSVNNSVKMVVLIIEAILVFDGRVFFIIDMIIGVSK